MPDRKRLEEAIENSDRIGSLTDDLDTLFELAREGEAVSNDIERELKSFSELLTQLETEMLLSGENDSLNAIMTIHPGAGGTESQDLEPEMLPMRMYLHAGPRRHKVWHRESPTAWKAKARASSPSLLPEVNGAECTMGCCNQEIGVHRLVRYLAVRFRSAAAHVVCIGVRLPAD